MAFKKKHLKKSRNKTKLEYLSCSLKFNIYGTALSRLALLPLPHLARDVFVSSVSPPPQDNLALARSRPRARFTPKLRLLSSGFHDDVGLKTSRYEAVSVEFRFHSALYSADIEVARFPKCHGVLKIINYSYALVKVKQIFQQNSVNYIFILALD